MKYVWLVQDDFPTQMPSCVVLQEPLIRMSQMQQQTCDHVQVSIFGVVAMFWRLLPPDGCLLGDIPCEFIQASRRSFPAPTVAHGQSLLWRDAPTGMTRVTELQKCERTIDAWLRSIQDEFRFGKLTEQRHAFY